MPRDLLNGQLLHLYYQSCGWLVHNFVFSIVNALEIPVLHKAISIILEKDIRLCSLYKEVLTLLHLC